MLLQKSFIKPFQQILELQKILKDVDWEILTLTKYFKKLQWAETWIIFPKKNYNLKFGLKSTLEHSDFSFSNYAISDVKVSC